MVLVLFLCSSNIGRSQIAEAYFNHFSKKHKAVSAGTNYRGDSAMSPTFKRMLELEGVSTKGQVPKALDPEIAEKADKIVALCSRAECPVYALKSGKIVFWDIPEVEEKSQEYKIKVKELIKKNVQQLLVELGPYG